MRERLDPAVRDLVREIDLKAQGVKDYGKISGGFGKSGSTGLELFVDDVPKHISRYPNEGFIYISEVLGETRVNVRGTKGTKEGVFRIEDKRVARWAAGKRPNALMGYWFWDWADERQELASIDPEKTGTHTRRSVARLRYARANISRASTCCAKSTGPANGISTDGTAGYTCCRKGRTKPRRSMVSQLPALSVRKGANIVLLGFMIEGARNAR